MCRSIKTLRRDTEPATDEEIHAAALQFVRKIAGYRSPSRVNLEPFEAAVDQIASASHTLLVSLKEIREANSKPSSTLTRRRCHEDVLR